MKVNYVEEIPYEIKGPNVVEELGIRPRSLASTSAAERCVYRLSLTLGTRPRIESSAIWGNHVTARQGRGRHKGLYRISGFRSYSNDLAYNVPRRV